MSYWIGCLNIVFKLVLCEKRKKRELESIVSAGKNPSKIKGQEQHVTHSLRIDSNQNDMFTQRHTHAHREKFLHIFSGKFSSSPLFFAVSEVWMEMTCRFSVSRLCVPEFSTQLVLACHWMAISAHRRRGICINIRPQNLANESVTQSDCLCGKVERKTGFLFPSRSFSNHSHGSLSTEESVLV